MKRFFLLFAASGALLCAAELSQVRTVYLLPMAKGLDQYLANRLTNEHLFKVVTDPTKADAIFTDKIGEGLEQKLSEILPDPEDSKPAPAPDPKPAAKQPAPPSPTDVRGDIGIGSETVNKLAKAGSNSSFVKSKGTVFLVDAKSRLVVWSAFEPPKGSAAHQLDHTASQLVSLMKRELKKKEQ
jgi:hypothetical protein